MTRRLHARWLGVMLVSVVVFLLAAATARKPVATSDPAREVSPDKKSIDCEIYTGVYKTRNDGAYMLPAGTHWRVEPKYVGSDGKTTWTDDRLTVILEDTPNSFWPVIVKMSMEEAEKFQRELAFQIAQKKKEQKQPAEK